MKQLDWIAQQNTRERVAKLLAAPFSRMIGVRVWRLPNGRVLKCRAGHWSYAPHWPEAATDGCHQVAGRAASRRPRFFRASS